MVLLTINSVDFTQYVNVKTYTMQRLDSYTSWTDGNWVTHRVIARQKVSGSFTMTFTTEAAYNAFKAAVNAVKTEGYCPVSVYVTNEKTTRMINAFLDYTTRLVWTNEAFGQTPDVAAVSVKIEEC